MEYSLDPLKLFWNATWVVKLVMLVLVVMSLLTWAIVIYKFIEFYFTEKEDQEFEKFYRNEDELDVIYRRAKRSRLSIKAKMFAGVYAELKKIVKAGGIFEDDNLQRCLEKAREEKRLKMEKFMTFLSTTASSAPFIGLFGTVWGIMYAFFKIGHLKSVGLPVVAPPIAEALIATAFGLLAAIPAAIFYNYFLSRMRRFFSSAQLFSSDFLNILKRHFLSIQREEIKNEDGI